MREPFAYYGGKSRLAPQIIPHIPRHTVYVEPFCGGATLFWRKPTLKYTDQSHYTEVLNDTNGEVINFFRVMQKKVTRKTLLEMLRWTPYSRENYIKSKEFCVDPIERAYNFFCNISNSYGNKLNGGWGYCTKGGNIPLTFRNRIKNLYSIGDRLLNVYLENEDALSIIDRFDSGRTFFYLDPPYPNTHQGHYKGYKNLDYSLLINKLRAIKGSFILSCYAQNKELAYWEKIELSATSSISKQLESRGKRFEIIWIHKNNIDDPIYNRKEFLDIWPKNENFVKKLESKKRDLEK